MRRFNLIMLLAAGLFAASTTANAQSLKDLLKKENLENLMNNTSGGKGSPELAGTWTYASTVIDFKTEELKKKAGGDSAANKTKKKLDEQLNKIGVKPGTVAFTFNEDGTFTATMNKKGAKGAYTYDKATSTANFIFGGFFALDSKVNYSPNKTSFMFDADKLILLLTFLSQQNDDATLKKLTELASEHEGMLVGLEMKK